MNGGSEAPTERRSSTVITIIALTVLGVAFGYFAWRGVLRATELAFDLKYGYATIQALLAGLNPYDPAHLEQVLIAGGGTTEFIIGELRNVYFPFTLPVFLPISVGTWPQAHAAAVVLNVVLVAGIILGLLRYLRWPLLTVRSILFAAAVLALAPIHTSMADGQTSIPAVAALVGALVLARREAVSGVLIGLSTAIKVQVGLPYIALALVRRRWRATVAAIALIVVLGAIAVIAMQLSGQPWLETWQDNLRWSSSPDGPNYAGPENPRRVSLVNLQYPLMQLGVSEPVADVVTFAVLGLAALAYLWSARRPGRGRDLLDMSMVGILALLLTYHRFYDAVLLVFPIAWAFAAWHAGHRAVAVLVLVCCADFLFPFQATLSVLEEGGSIPASLSGSLVWDAVLLAQHVWALVALTGVLLYAAARVDVLPGPEPDARGLVAPAT
jgi:hypothetical protein